MRSGRAASRFLVTSAALAALGAVACTDEVIRPQCVLVASVDSLQLTVGQTAVVHATSSCVGVDAPRVRWTSSAPAVVAIDSLTGIVTAHQTGAAMLHASVAGIASGSAMVAVGVNCPGLPAIAPTITPQSLVLPVGGTGRLRATSVVRTNLTTCATALDSTFTWRSLDPSVATVDATTGLVTAIGRGQTVVQATQVASPIITASVPVTVTARSGFFDPPAVAPTSLTLGVGGTQVLTVHVPIPPNAPAGTDTTARFRAADSCVATVSRDGLVFGRWPGTTTVTVLAAYDTTLRSAVGVTIVPTPIGPRLTIRSVASGTPPVPTTDRTVRGLVTVTFGIFYDIAPNGGRLDVMVGGRLAVAQPIPPIVTSPTPYVVSVTFDSDARDAAGVRLFPNGTLELTAGVVPNPPPPGGCLPTGAGQQVAMPLTVANP